MRKSFLPLALLCLGFFLEPGVTVTTSAENMLSDYNIRRWRGEDGLVEDIVNGVEQALDGYVWCVTQNQVLRFDGERFSPVDRKGLPSGTVTWRGVSMDHHGSLWLFGEGGVFKHDGHEWSSLIKAAGKNKANFYSMEEDSKGVMWGACEQGLYCFDGPKPVLFPCSVNGKPLPLLSMDVAPDGRILVIAKDHQVSRLFRFQNGTFFQQTLPAEADAENVLKVHVGPSGTTWVTTEKHLLCNSEGDWRSIPFPSDQSDWSGIRVILERQGGELWIGTVRGLFRLRGETWSELTTRDGFFPFAVRFLKEDREGGLWVAGTGGLMRLTPNALEVFLCSGLDKEPVVALLASGSEWWAGIPGMGPLVGIPGSFQKAKINSFPENITASALLKAHDGSLWIGTHSRNLWHWKDGKSEVILPKTGADVPSNAVTALLQDRAGKIWVGTLGGLQVVSPEGLIPVQVWNWHPRNTVNAIFEDADGTIWVGYQTLGLMKILRDGSSVWFKKADGLPDNSVRAIYRDRGGVMWIGTSAGLVRWMKNRQSLFTTAEGLLDNGIRQIIEDDFGYLWLGTRNGLMRVNLAEFSEVESGAKSTLAARCFGTRDGMKTEECTGVNPVKTADGKLWFPTADGLVMADARTLPRTSEAPLVQLEEVRVGQNLVWSSNPLDSSQTKLRTSAVAFPPQAQEIEFRFATLDYFAPERVLFKHRIEGLNEEWSTPTAARKAHFQNIPPGSYRFRVQACSREGVWSAEGTSLAFTVPPLFWQTVWFKAGGGAIAISAAAIIIVWSERRKARRKLRELEHEQALERERARIARDIHDEVGAGLTEVALLSELAQMSGSRSDQKYLDDIFQTARDLTRSLDEIVWSINPANDTLEKLIAYLVEFARDFLGTASLPCRLEVPTVVPVITIASTVRHQICLAVKETLNNIVKHAQATEVRMEIAWLDGTLRVLIIDNGRGFVRVAVSDPAATRDGLDNIESRMRGIGGACEQQSRIGEGSSTLLSVEIPTAAQHRQNG